MMHCFIYSREELIGHADFIGFDPGMNCTTAPFLPSENYEEVRSTVRAFSLLALTDINATRETKAHAAEVYQRCAALNLTAYTLSEEVLEPEGGITLFDFSDELDDDPYEVTLFGLPEDISEKYFHQAIQQYWGTDAEER